MLVAIKKVIRIDFFRHGINYILANFFSKGMVFLMIPLFTRILTPDEYGIYSLYISLISIFSILVPLNLQGAIKQSYLKRKEDFPELLGSNLLFIFLFVMPLSIFYILFKSNISDFFGISEKIFSLVIGVCLLMMFYNIYSLYLEASQQSSKLLILLCSNKIVETLLCIILLFCLTKDVYYAPMYAQIIITGILSVFCICKLVKIAKFNFKFEHLKYCLIYAIPLIPHNLSNFILAQFDRIALNQISGSYSVGIYSFAYNIGMAVTIIINSLNSSWVPIFFEKYEENKFQELEELAKKFFKIIYVFAVIIILFSQEITILLSTKSYYSSFGLIPIIVLGNLITFFYVLYANYSFYYNKTYMISLNTFIAGVTNIILNYIFIPKYGYIAAGYTTLFSYIVLFLLHYSYSRYLLKAKVIPLSTFKNEFFRLFLIIIIYFICLQSTQVSTFFFLLKILIVIGLLFFELKKYYF